MASSKRALIQNVLEHIRGEPLFTELVHYGSVPNQESTDAPLPAPYIVVHSDLGPDERERVTSEVSTRTDVSISVMAVGVDADQALWWADKLTARLLDYKPVVDGWQCSALRHVGSAAVQDLTEHTPSVHYTSDDYDLTARRT